MNCRFHGFRFALPEPRIQGRRSILLNQVIADQVPLLRPQFMQALRLDSCKLVGNKGDAGLLSCISSYQCPAVFWRPSRVDASLMDPKTTTWLEQRLAKLNVVVLPLLNVWATSVCHADTLAVARNII